MVGEATGGNAKTGEVREPGVGRSGVHGVGGRASDSYLADLVEANGQPATEVQARPKEPTVMWVSKANKTREDDELDDMAAQIPDDPATGDLIRANAGFRGS